MFNVAGSMYKRKSPSKWPVTEAKINESKSQFVVYVTHAVYILTINNQTTNAFNKIQGHGAATSIKSMKNPNDPIGNWTHDLQACTAVAQITVSLCTPQFVCSLRKSTGWAAW